MNKKIFKIDLDKIKLVRLNKDYKNQLEEMLSTWKEYIREKGLVYESPYAIFKNDYHDFDYYLDNLEIKEETEKLVPDSTFFAYDTEHDIFLGAINIRHKSNDNLINDGGHIGDGVRPDYRRCGVATRMIKLALEECKKIGLKKVLMTCDDDNIGSKKSIIRNGGVHENDFVDKDGVVVNRYWITIDDDTKVIEDTDEKFISEFSEKFKFSDSLIKYQDDVVKYKYDHNYFWVCHIPTSEEINKAIEYQKSIGLDYVKFISSYDFRHLEVFKGFEFSHNVGMMYMGEEYKEINKYDSPNLEFKEASLEEVISLEQKNFGEEYGYDFIKRASTEYYGHVNFIGAYLDGKMVSYCYVYDRDGIRNIDGLCTDSDYRRRGIATALIKHVTTTAHKCYLHADYDDDPKKIYYRLGYRDVNDSYEYFLSLKNR